MPRDKVQPQRMIRPPVIVREMNSVRFAATHLREHIAKRPLMARFAIHDHSVHVENNGLESFHRSGIRAVVHPVKLKESRGSEKFAADIFISIATVWQ